MGTQAAVKIVKELEKQAFTHAEHLSERIPVSAGLIWTSSLRLELPDGRSMEFCPLINRILRDLDDDLLPHACRVVRGINAMCVLRSDSSKLTFPPGAPIRIVLVAALDNQAESTELPLAP